MSPWAKWAAEAAQLIAALQRGETVKFRPRGGSMIGRIESGQLCEVEPAKEVAEDDIVLVKVRGSVYLHIVKLIGRDGRYQIGNNKGHINGWVERDAIYGRLVSVSD